MTENYDDKEMVVLSTGVSFLDEELPGMPQHPEPNRPYSAVVTQIVEALEYVDSEIEAKVALRAAINGEIKVLREEAERLTRMKKIAEAK